MEQEAGLQPCGVAVIKARATTDDGREIVVLGISDGNIARLREGKPIHLHGEEMGLSKIDIWIFAGKDEAALQQMLAPMIGPETVVRDMQKVAKQ